MCKRITQNELRTALLELLDKLSGQKYEYLSFSLAGCRQTPKPVNLSIIRNNIINGNYIDAWEFIDDVLLMFENARGYYRRTSCVYRDVMRLFKVFETVIDPFMQSLGYCCGRKYTFSPQQLCCNSQQQCLIPLNAIYYSYQSSVKEHGEDTKPYNFCQKCYNGIESGSIILSDDTRMQIDTDQVKKLKNNINELEPFVHCQKCGRKQHQICVLWMNSFGPGVFLCENSPKLGYSKRIGNKLNAKSLPNTKLDIYIEKRVKNFFEKMQICDDKKLHIRAVHSANKSFKIKPGMSRLFLESGQETQELPYRAKALFAFQEVDGIDVCFFGMHVQEYSSECPAPNTRIVYVAYIDSVPFFRPAEYRTAVYQEILLGYMDYVKQLGFTKLHIWSCPATKGVDYIFYRHPSYQKMPTARRLQQWYKNVLDKGKVERVLDNYKDILEQALEDKLAAATELPYFKDDIWPNALEQIIKNFERQTMTTTNSSATLCNKIYDVMAKQKKSLFVISLHSAQSAASLAPIQDPDPLFTCDLTNGVEPFLTLACENRYEFSSLRRAQFSTLCMLHELHKAIAHRLDNICKNCRIDAIIRYGCTVCNNFNLCTVCKEYVSHEHKMQKIGLEMKDGPASSDLKQAYQLELRKKIIDCCLQSLVHACQCRVANCQLSVCQKMKLLLVHIKYCKLKTNGSCPACKKLIALSCYHATICHEPLCTVPLCPKFKKQRQLELMQVTRC